MPFEPLFEPTKTFEFIVALIEQLPVQTVSARIVDANSAHATPTEPMKEHGKETAPFDLPLDVLTACDLQSAAASNSHADINSLCLTMACPVGIFFCAASCKAHRHFQRLQSREQQPWRAPHLLDRAARRPELFGRGVVSIIVQAKPEHTWERGIDDLVAALFQQVAEGKTAFQSAGPALPDIEAFQQTVRGLRELEANGYIEILDEHTESQTGNRLIDLVLVRKR